MKKIATILGSAICLAALGTWYYLAPIKGARRSTTRSGDLLSVEAENKESSEQ